MAKQSPFLLPLQLLSQYLMCRKQCNDQRAKVSIVIWVSLISTLTVVTDKYLSVDRALHKKTVAFLWGKHATNKNLPERTCQLHKDGAPGHESQGIAHVELSLGARLLHRVRGPDRGNQI